MQRFLFRDTDVMFDQWQEYKEIISSLPSVFNTGRFMDGADAGRRVKGSYTVEAALVMAAVLWTIVMLIQLAYNIHDITKGSMVLQEELELYRHDSDLPASVASERAKNKGGHPFSFSKYQFKFENFRNNLMNKKARGVVTGGEWKLEIEIGVFDPENFLRMLALTDSEEN